jgi:hypothetical protein
VRKQQQMIRSTLLILLVLSLSPITGVMGQVSSPLQQIPTPEEMKDTIIFGPTILLDRQNYNHYSGYSLYVPDNWTADYRLDESDGRIRAHADSPTSTEYQFEVPATLCEYDESYRFVIEDDRAFICQAAAMQRAPLVTLYMYPSSQCNCEDPLDHHIEVLRQRYPYAMLMSESVMNVTDTLINYTNPDTKETIQQLPAKRADIMIVDQRSSANLLDQVRVETILYTVVDTGDPPSIDFGRDIYILSHIRPIISEQLEGTLQTQVSLDPTIQDIFDSFEIIPKQ